MTGPATPIDAGAPTRTLLRLRLARWIGPAGDGSGGEAPAARPLAARRWMVRIAGHPEPLRVLRWTLAAADAGSPQDEHLAAYLAAVHGIKVGAPAARRIRQRLGAAADGLRVSGTGVATAAPRTTSISARELRDVLGDPTVVQDPARPAATERPGGVLEN